MAKVRFPAGGPNRKQLQEFGPRLEIEVGPPVVRSGPSSRPTIGVTSSAPRFSRMPALVDTGASRTVLTPLAIETVGLRVSDYTGLARAGGTDKVPAVVCSIQFPRYKLSTIEMIQVLSCELPEQPIQCLIGRDIMSRWLFTYDGRNGEWFIDEDDIAAWVEPPDSAY